MLNDDWSHGLRESEDPDRDARLHEADAGVGPLLQVGVALFFYVPGSGRSCPLLRFGRPGPVGERLGLPGCTDPDDTSRRHIVRGTAGALAILPELRSRWPWSPAGRREDARCLTRLTGSVARSPLLGPRKALVRLNHRGFGDQWVGPRRSTMDGADRRADRPAVLPNGEGVSGPAAARHGWSEPQETTDTSVLGHYLLEAVGCPAAAWRVTMGT